MKYFRRPAAISNTKRLFAYDVNYSLNVSAVIVKKTKRTKRVFSYDTTESLCTCLGATRVPLPWSAAQLESSQAAQTANSHQQLMPKYLEEV